MTPCIEAIGSTTGSGYGMARLNGLYTTAHRIAWIKEYGYIPKGLVIDHLCSNKRCINIEHLEPVTPSENMKRAAQRPNELGTAIQTHCKNGHLLDGTRRDGNKNKRYCKTCNKINKQRERARNKCIS